jgi:hypothetical protein
LLGSFVGVLGSFRSTIELCESNENISFAGRVYSAKTSLLNGYWGLPSVSLEADVIGVNIGLVELLIGNLLHRKPAFLHEKESKLAYKDTEGVWRNDQDFTVL